MGMFDAYDQMKNMKAAMEYRKGKCYGLDIHFSVYKLPSGTVRTVKG